MTRFKFIRSRLLAGPPKFSWALALGVAAVGAPTLLRLAADSLITGTAFVTYYPFVLMAALVIGWRGAGAVAATSAVLANFLFMEPRYLLFANTGDTLGTAFFLVSCGMMIGVVDTLRRAVVDVETLRRREASLNAELKHLNSELQHRVKNTLSVVQGLATQTFRGASGSDEIVRTFRGRLQALGAAHSILTSGRWEMCQLPDLAARALAPFNGDGAISTEGPTCAMPEEACVPLVLALHELGTNAVKYGALSTLGGKVEVRWTVRQADAQDAGHELVLEWIESGGPPVAPPTHQGLGSKLVARQRGIDEAILDFRPEGLACRIVAGGAVLAPSEHDWADAV
jgi:two-component sensor histidine kinase